MIDQKLRDSLVKGLENFPQIKLAILFGSVASGKERPGSDIDLGIAADHVLTFEDKSKINSMLFDICGRPVDLIDLQKKQEPILTQVLTKGLVLFCHDKRLYAELIKTMMFDQADFMPYRSRILKERREKWINS